MGVGWPIHEAVARLGDSHQSGESHQKESATGGTCSLHPGAMGQVFICANSVRSGPAQGSTENVERHKLVCPRAWKAVYRSDTGGKTRQTQQRRQGLPHFRPQRSSPLCLGGISLNRATREKLVTSPRGAYFPHTRVLLRLELL